MAPMSDMERLADLIQANNLSDLQSYFAARGAKLEMLLWSPTPAALSNETMRFLIEYWHRLRGNDPMPQAAAVSPFDLRPALGHIVLIDVLDDGWDGRFRLYGTKVAETYGRDMTGRLVSEIDGGNYISAFFRALYRSAWLRREAFFTHHFPPSHVAVSSWQRLALPLCDTDGRVTRFLASNLAGPWRAPRPADG